MRHLLLCTALCLAVCLGYWLKAKHIPGRTLAAIRHTPIQPFVPHRPAPMLGEDTEISVMTRRFDYGSGTETDSKNIEEVFAIRKHKTALVLIDVWDDELPRRFIDHAMTNLLPLVRWARENEILILHAPHGRKVASFLNAENGPREVILEQTDANTLASWLKEQGIGTLLYAGYSANGCMLQRTSGMLPMRRRGFDIVLSRDATLAYETPESLPQQWGLHVTANMVEGFIGRTTRLVDLELSTSALTDTDTVPTISMPEFIGPAPVAANATPAS